MTAILFRFAPFLSGTKGQYDGLFVIVTYPGFFVSRLCLVSHLVLCYSLSEIHSMTQSDIASEMTESDIASEITQSDIVSESDIVGEMTQSDIASEMTQSDIASYL